MGIFHVVEYTLRTKKRTRAIITISQENHYIYMYIYTKEDKNVLLLILVILPMTQ